MITSFEIARILRFCGSGLVGVTFYYAILFGLTEAGLWYMASAITGSLVNTVISFIMHRSWTFQHKGYDNIRNQMSNYAAMRLCIFCLNLLMLYLLVEFVGLWYMGAQVLTSMFVTVIAYLISRRIFVVNPQSQIL